MSRIITWLFTATIVLTFILVLDLITYEFMDIRGGLDGLDYVVLTGSVIFLAMCFLNRPLARKTSISILIFAVCVMAMEIGRAVVIGPAPDFPWYVWPPNYHCTLRPKGLHGVSEAGQFTTNSRGIRGKELDPKDTYRVLCIGGSTTECLYLDDTKTWPRQLENRLSQYTDQPWVGNVGRSGMTAHHHVTLLEHLPEAHLVDCWLVLCGLNDMGQQLRGTYAANAQNTWNNVFAYRHVALGRSTHRPLHRNFFIFHLLEILRKRFKVMMHSQDAVAFQDVKAEWIVDRVKSRLNKPHTDQLPDIKPFLEEYERNLVRLVRLSREREVLLVMATQPTGWSDNITPQYDANLLGTQLPDGRYIAIAKLAEVMAQFNDKMRQVCKRENVPCIDLAKHVPKGLDSFYDDAHFNEQGARIVATLLAESLMTMIPN